MEQLSERLSADISNTPFRNRPLALILAVFLCALFLFQTDTLQFAVYAAVIVLYSVKLLFFSGKRRKNPIAIVLPLMLVIAVCLCIPSIHNYNKVKALNGERTVKAVIVDVYYEENYGSMYFAELKEIDGERVGGNATLEFDYNVGVGKYDTVVFDGIIESTRETLSGDELLLAKSKNTVAEIECKTVNSVTGENKKGVAYFSFVVSTFLKDRLYSLLPQRTAGYASAILLGDKSGATASFKNDMSRLGTSHILAVSGMHLSVIAAIASFVSDKFKSSRKVKSTVIILSAVCFTFVAGFSVSVVRAGIMLTVSMLSVFAHGRNDPLTSLMISGTVICCVNPMSALSCGFLLSFFATLGIVLCAVYAESNARKKLYASRVGDFKAPYKLVRRFASSVLVSFCASLFTIPVMSLYFSEVSFVSVFTNLIAVPMAFVSVLLTLLTLLLGSVPVIGQLICLLYGNIYNLFEKTAEYISDSFVTTVSLKYPFFKACIVLLAAILVFMLVMRVKNPIMLIGALTSVAILFVGGVQLYRLYNADRVEVVYTAEPNSEGVIVNSGSDTLYIDISNGSQKIPKYCIDIAENEYYETELDGYMLTHYHSRHISTLTKLLSTVKIKNIYLPMPYTESEKQIFSEISELAENTKIVAYERGKAFEFGNTSISTLDYTLLERSEHPIIALKISANGKSVAYIGASVTESSAYLKAEELLNGAGAVICGFHGPVVKENDSFLSFSKGSSVYLSPYEKADEATVFPLGVYEYISADANGYARVKLRLSD